MRKHFDYLLRSTLFVNMGSLDGALALCKELGFRHLMLGERTWSKSSGWYECAFSGGYQSLKRYIQECHDADTLVTLHTRTTRVSNGDAMAVEPVHPELEKDGNYLFVDPYSSLHKEMAARLVEVADLVNADGIYLDGAEVAARNYPNKVLAAINTGQRDVFANLTRPMLLQSSSTNAGEVREYWAWKGQLDHYPNRVRCGFEGTRAEWNQKYFESVQDALSRGFPSQVGWIDVGHGLSHQGKPIEDQTPESMQELCDYAMTHNVPIVLETPLDELETHPKRDEIKDIIRNYHFRGR